jgi:hypothetical protein
MALKAFLAVIGLMAISIGLLLPMPVRDRAEARSQFAVLEVGRD